VWALGFTLLGYLAGASYHTLEKIAGRASLGILAVIVIAGLGIMIQRRRRERAGEDRATAGESPTGGNRASSGWRSH
jgi:membrane-associated protein